LDGSKEARDAQTSLDIQVTRLEKVLSATIKEFATALIPWKYGSEGSAQGLKAVLTLLDSGIEGYWSVRAKFGWFREFVRKVSCVELRVGLSSDILIV
jgi:nuclear cap-binding protein subunit 1